MSISGIGQNYYHNNVATVRNTKNVNSTGKNDGFAGKVTEKNPVSPEDMTLEEYKAYFNEKMDALYTHPSQRNMNWVIDITDAAYKRMQTDPEYEQKILDALAKNKAVDFGGNIPQIAYTHVDSTWEGCYGYTKGMKENDSYTKGISSKHENNVAGGRRQELMSNNINNNNVKKKNEKDRKKQILEEYIEEQIQARKDILGFRKEENFKHKEQNIELNKKALALRAYNQQILEEH